MSNKGKSRRRKKLKIKKEITIKDEKNDPVPSNNSTSLAQAIVKPEKEEPKQQAKIEVLENNSSDPVPSNNSTSLAQAIVKPEKEEPKQQAKIEVLENNSDPDNCRRLGVDEQYIKFRPSPNFKNMKKFLKSKIDHSESSSQSPPNGSSEQTTPNDRAVESPPANQQQMEKSPVKPVIHPPLPLEPPPPDPVPVMPVPIKNEIIDNEYPDQENGHESPNLSTAETDEASLRLSFEGKSEEPDSTSTERPKVTICRDFIRGTCSRTPCRFAHQRDLTQLSRVYTFCRNYQNAVCTLPLCKYVHASVFEEQEFYRTGILPPHVQNHMKQKPNVPFFVLPPPPPPPPEEAPPEVQIASALSPRQLNVPDKPLISCVPVSKLESKPAENDFRNILQAIASPLKREWSSIAAFSPPPRDLDNKENFKKCKHCDNMDFRVQYHKEKMENMANSTKELQLKSLLLTRKTNLLFDVLFALVRQEASTMAGLHKLASKLSMCGDKEREVLHIVFGTDRTHYN